MFAPEDFAHVLWLLQHGFAAVDKIAATMNPSIGKSTTPIKIHISILIQPNRILAKVNDVLFIGVGFG